MTYASVSRTGGRSANEDRAVCIERNGNYCFAVADGLGAHGKGGAAAEILTDVCERELRAEGEKGRDFLRRVFDTAQDEITAAQRTPSEMRTTAVVLSVINGRFTWGHIGDSRLYWFRRGRLRKRTLDHSVPQMLVSARQIKETDIARHPDRNVLLKSMGDKWDSPYTCYEISGERRLSGNDAFLLCSDGFWEHLTADTIGRLLKGSGNAEEWLGSLLSAAESGLDASEADNYTAVAVIN